MFWGVKFHDNLRAIGQPFLFGRCLLAGAHHLTLPFGLLQAIAVHELSLQTVDEFAKNGRGISY
jgi:hypothetical protein